MAVDLALFYVECSKHRPVSGENIVDATFQGVDLRETICPPISRCLCQEAEIDTAGAWDRIASVYFVETVKTDEVD